MRDIDTSAECTSLCTSGSGWYTWECRRFRMSSIPCLPYKRLKQKNTITVTSERHTTLDRTTTTSSDSYFSIIFQPILLLKYCKSFQYYIEAELITEVLQIIPVLHCKFRKVLQILRNTQSIAILHYAICRVLRPSLSPQALEALLYLTNTVSAL